MADCRIEGLEVAPLVVRAVVDLCTRGWCLSSVRRRMACLTRAESRSCSTGGTLASLLWVSLIVKMIFTANTFFSGFNMANHKKSIVEVKAIVVPTQLFIRFFGI